MALIFPFFPLSDTELETYVSSNLQPLLFTHKVVHQEDFSLPQFFKTTPKALVHLSSIFSLYPHTKPAHL